MQLGCKTVLLFRGVFIAVMEKVDGRDSYSEFRYRNFPQSPDYTGGHPARAREAARYAACLQGYAASKHYDDEEAKISRR